jgi:hypothetical protein
MRQRQRNHRHDSDCHQWPKGGMVTHSGSSRGQPATTPLALQAPQAQAQAQAQTRMLA